MVEDEAPKTKTEERKDLLKELSEKADESRKILEEIRQERERIEELRAKEILGGKTDLGAEPTPVKEETAQEYAYRTERGIFKPGELY